MTKKRISYFLKRYSYIVNAISNGETSVHIVKKGSKEIINITENLLLFVNIVKKIYEAEQNNLIKKFIKRNIVYGKRNLISFSDQPIDRSTYFRYKKEFIDKVYHCCIYYGLVDIDEILAESICN